MREPCEEQPTDAPQSCNASVPGRRALRARAPWMALAIAAGGLVMADSGPNGHLPVQRAAAIAFAAAREAGYERFSIHVQRRSGAWSAAIFPIPGGFLSEPTVSIEDNGTWRVTRGAGRLPLGKSGPGGGSRSGPDGTDEASLVERAVAIGVEHVKGADLRKDKLTMARVTGGLRLGLKPPELDPRPSSALFIRDDGTVETETAGEVKGYDEQGRVVSCTTLYGDGRLASHRFYVYGSEGFPEHHVTHLGNGQTWFFRLAPDGTALERKIIYPTGRTQVLPPGGQDRQ